MIDVRVNAPLVERFEVNGAGPVVASEFASLIGLYHAELKKHSQQSADNFKRFMQSLVLEDGLLWDAPPLKTESEMIRFGEP